VELEKHLEGWVTSDPGLVERGLLVVRRQLHVDGGSGTQPRLSEWSDGRTSA
jgi:hypothetical protein